MILLGTQILKSPDELIIKKLLKSTENKEMGLEHLVLSPSLSPHLHIQISLGNQRGSREQIISNVINKQFCFSCKTIIFTLLHAALALPIGYLETFLKEEEEYTVS